MGVTRVGLHSNHQWMVKVNKGTVISEPGWVRGSPKVMTNHNNEGNGNNHLDGSQPSLAFVAEASTGALQSDFEENTGMMRSFRTISTRQWMDHIKRRDYVWLHFRTTVGPRNQVWQSTQIRLVFHGMFSGTVFTHLFNRLNTALLIKADDKLLLSWHAEMVRVNPQWGFPGIFCSIRHVSFL